MARELTEAEIVQTIQRSLSENSLAIAYFSRTRVYSFYTFDSIDAFITFFGEKQPECIYLDEKEPKQINFLIDEWFIFGSETMAKEILAKIRAVFPEDND